ncbi:DUF6731 family protein [Streptococcus sp. H31]|uniref:DUF6731 family protein n=1 Tax=Streptococcus huangxiaojuni TaxID=3237239 RepID=UPI0034A441B7
MKIQYYNVFLYKNGEKTNYDLSKLIDYLSERNPVERTVKLGSQNILFLHTVRQPLIGKNIDGTTKENHEFLTQNRSFWLGKYRTDKPYEGKIGEEELKKIDGDLFEPSLCLLIPSSHLFLMENKFLGPTIKQVEEYFESFLKPLINDNKFKIRFEAITRETLRDLIPASESIKSLTVTIHNEAFQLSNLFPDIDQQNKTLLEKLFGNLIEVSNQLDINTTTVMFKKGRFKREMNVSKIDKILKLMNVSDKNLKSAKVKFKNPRTHSIEEIDLKFDGFHVTEKTTQRYSSFEMLANLMTEHYYDDRNADKDNEYLKYGNLTICSDSDFDYRVSNTIE